MAPSWPQNSMEIKESLWESWKTMAKTKPQGIYTVSVLAKLYVDHWLIISRLSRDLDQPLKPQSTSAAAAG